VRFRFGTEGGLCKSRLRLEIGHVPGKFSVVVGNHPGNSKVRSKSKLLIAGAAVVAVTSGWLVLRAARSPQPDSAVTETETVPPTAKRVEFTPIIREVKLRESTGEEPEDSTFKRKLRGTSTGAAQPLPSGSALSARDALTRVLQMDYSQRALTSEQAGQINEWLRQLAAQGPAAVSSIREFLSTHEDINFDALKGGEFVEFGTLRQAVLDALDQIGGEAGVQLAAETLQSTTDPLELALLTSTLERWAPGQYRETAFSVARATLALAASGQLDGRDVSPIFEMFQQFGDSSVVADLEKAVQQWNYYATLALAGLPEGAGIPALINLAQDPNIGAIGPGDFALRPLTQVALQYPEARAALIQQAGSNQIPDTAWPNVTASLAGAHIQYVRPIFGSSVQSAQWTEREVRDRLALVDEMLRVTANPAGYQMLQKARQSLVARLPSQN